MLKYTVSPNAYVLKAIKASGVIVQVNADTFLKLLVKADNPLLITACNYNFFSKSFQYLLSYKSFIFFVESKQRLIIPDLEELEMIEADAMILPY